MKLVKGLKTPSRKKIVAKSLADLPETITQTVAPVAKPAETTTGSARSSAKPVTIEAKIDVGFGNALFLRGQAPGLSWDKGIPLTCVDGKTWRWTGPSTDKLTFKLLLNDNVWAKGQDLVVAPGQKVEVAPTF
jgi:hypothetical protein